MKVVVTGGRDFRDEMFVRQVLSGVHKRTPIMVLIHGGCNSGADKFAGRWAQDVGVPSKVFQANWIMYGNAAGPRRNAEMIADGPDLVIAFPGGKGTMDCVGKARAAGVPVFFPDEIEVQRDSGNCQDE